MSTDEERLVLLVEKMHSRIPADKRLSTPVVVQLLSAKYKEQFPTISDFATKAELITETLKRLQAPPPAPVAAPVVTAVKKPETTTTTATTKKDSDNEDDSDADSDDESYHEEDEEESEEESDFDDDDDEDGSEEDSAVEKKDRPAKRPREENGKESDSSSSSEDEKDEDEGEEESEAKPDAPKEDVTQYSFEKRVEMMQNVISKLNYRTSRKQKEGESAEEYMNAVLIPVFTAKKLDPLALSTDDIRRYKLLKELGELQADGGNMNLDRSTRRGRYNPPPQQSATAPRPVFMDEEE